MCGNVREALFIKAVLFLLAFAKLQKAIISFVMSAVCLSACLSVRMEHISFHWMDLHEI
jgi:hypothetical protein